METTQKKLEKLIPFTTSNILSYDLWEEGHYNIPFLRIFQIFDKEELKKFNKRIKKFNQNNKGYVFEVEDKDCYRTMSNKTYIIKCYPDFDYNDNGTVYHLIESWSIEEMIDLMFELINN